MGPTDHVKAPGSDQTVSQLLSALQRGIDTASPGALAELLGSLETLKAIAWGRLLAIAVPAEPTRPEPLDDLRHLTPIQVADLLSLKEAYIHELCRSRQIPATKQGKYWIIPVAELREWLVRARGIDAHRPGSLALPDRTGTRMSHGGGRDPAPVASTGARRRPRIAIHRDSTASVD